MKKQDLKKLCVSALFLSLGLVLSEFVPNIPIPLIHGGSATIFSMVPVCLIGIAFGFNWGLSTGLVYGVIQLIFGIHNVTYAGGISEEGAIIVVLFDYIIAYAVLGFSGIFNKAIKNRTLSAVLGVILALILRYACHFITGVTIWRTLTNTWDAVWFSLTYNGAYMIPEIILTALGIGILMKANILKVLEK